MRLPVPTSIERQWEVLDLVTVNVIVQSEDGAKACLCKDRMGSLKLNMIVRDISNGSRKSFLHQEFFDGEMRKLDDSRIPILDYDDQTRARRHDCFFLILPPPVCIQLRDPFRLEVKRQDFCKFLNLKWANSCHQTMQQSKGMSFVRLLNLP